MFRVVKKLKQLKRRLRSLNRQHFRNIITEADEDRIALAQAQAALHLQPLDRTLQEQEKRSKATWIKQGADNARYFFSVIKHRKLQQAIIQMKDKEGVMHNDQQEIARILVEYYQNLLGTKEEHRTKASGNLLGNGCVLNTAQQVKEAMFGIGINKSLGPDGYGSGFFRAAWSVIGNDVTQAILEFFENGKLLKQINSTIISLIPKVDAPELASQFRPISCCNVIYKCISKMICMRLRKAISVMVASNQAAFVEGRSLIHNVLICHDLLRHYSRKTTPRCLMKIDLRKAYDMIRWDFIEEALKGYGFPTPFVQLIMICVTSTRFTVKVNGEGYG
ncbi:uncharacterized protein LOC132624775 [Lycium barbarum]|uniref:uncharacterized protein LOC132624775 n=1 Tax=Lycium barbarum TaxID=112863 RepID=UPI00293E8EBA|nr:uncharacterized protein LOC132624775 [Lycium barbarum]